MVELDRKLQKIFAGGVLPNNVLGIFGSGAEGSPAYSGDLDVLQSLDAYIEGFASAVINNSAPAMQDMNTLHYIVTTQLSYLFQQGVPLWLATETYYVGSVAKDANGILYRSLTSANLNNALTDTAHWVPLADVATAAIAGLITLDQNVESGMNYFSNANFHYAQRGTSHSTVGYGSIDRMFLDHNGSTATMEQQDFTLGQTDVPNDPRHFCRTIVSSSVGVANYGYIQTRIEYVETLSDTEVTYSFWAKADAIKDMTVEFVQHFGTGGSPSSDVTALGVQKFTLSTTWQKFTHTFTLPNIQGKSLGTSGSDSLRVYFWFDAGSDFNARTDNLGQQSGIFDIANVKLEQGSEATKFQLRNITLDRELIHCQRFYEEYYNANFIRDGFAITDGSNIGLHKFRVLKRKFPFVSIHFDTTLGTAGKVRGTGGTAIDVDTFVNATDGVYVRNDNGANISFIAYSCGIKADAEL